MSRIISKLKTPKILSRVTLGAYKNKQKYLTRANNLSLTNVLIAHSQIIVEF